MEDQYRDASNLNARITLHERFSTNNYGWYRWVFDQFELSPDARILEAGCGPGDLWAENLYRTPEGWEITLTDLSPGMLREAGRKVGNADRFRFRVADAQELPFEDAGFDAVIANLMLHHVPDTKKAVSEFHLILEPGGTLYATANGESHMSELGRMLQILDPSHPVDRAARSTANFNLENGAEQLWGWFSEVHLRRYEDALVVTEVEPLVDYALSMMDARAVRERLSEEEFRERVFRLTGVLERELTSQGVIHISKDTGLFVARR